MMQLELYDLTPLIEASDVWASDPSHTLWLRNERGRVLLSKSLPENLFAELRTVQSLDALPPISNPTVCVEWPSGRHTLCVPDAWDTEAPYVGRPYVLGKYDCYNLVRDWMQRERGIAMEYLTDTFERVTSRWATEGAFYENNEMQYWDRVAIPQPGDGILFCMARQDDVSPGQANHCGVYIGDGTFLHHFINRASCFEEFDSAWRNRVVGYMRRKSHG